jgi:competence protein ComEA
MTLFRICSTALVFTTLLSGAALAQSTPTPSPRSRATAATQSEEKIAPVNLNTATAAELEKLPGIGPKVAARIVDYRTKKGPFRKTEELMNVQGIGEKSYLKLRAQLTVSVPASPSQQ